METVAITGPAHEALLDELYAGLYLAEFAAQREPLAVWKQQLWGAPGPYTLVIRVAGHALEDPARRAIAGAIAYELYPHSQCGLVTYMVVAPSSRRAGLGKRLQRDAIADLAARGAGWVFGEVVDPRRAATADREAAWRRLERNQRWGARVIDARYVQPALGAGLDRDPSLCLLALAPADGSPLPVAVPGAVVGAFVRELYDATEGPAAEIAERFAPVPLRLVELARGTGE